MVIKKDTLDQLLAGRDPRAVFAKDGLVDELKKALYWKEQLEKYMDQFLVNELSRRGLIPTYSFPVHSLT